MYSTPLVGSVTAMTLLIATTASAQSIPPASTTDVVSPPQAPASASGPESAPYAEAAPETEKPKLWGAGAEFETHHLIRQSDLQGAAANKHVNYYSVYTQLTPSKYDTVRLSGGIYERFLVDPGETGFRAGDIALSYRRLIPLPGKVNLSTSARISIPTSFSSMKSSLITAPGGRIGLERKFGHLTASVDAYGSVYITRYRESEGGAANPKYAVGISPDLTYALPFHERLSFGTSAILNWLAFQEVETGNDPNVKRTGAVQDPTFTTQPVQQGYGWQGYVRYELPKATGIASDITVAYAQGDSTLGSASWMHDGVGRFYLFWRENSQVYAALSARY